MCGAGQKCYDLECIVSDGPGNMCGGPRPTDPCFDCDECNAAENRCVPIAGCEPDMCFSDRDCERYNRMDEVTGQICVNNQCYLPDKVPGGCVGQDADCLGLDFFGCKVAGCYWNENRDDEVDERVLSAFNIASLESEEKGFIYDADGNIEYDEDGYAVLDEYAEMCGGPDADEECYECFECSRGGNRCIPIADCVPTCEVDDDCTREQICVEDEYVCRLPGGRPKGYRDSSSDEAGQGAGRKGGKGNRGDESSEESSSWGGPSKAVMSAHVGRIGIPSLEAAEKGFSYDDEGNIEYDDDGYAVLEEYPEMCAGLESNKPCKQCFECNHNGNRCTPVDGCIPTCDVNEDCTHEQICVERLHAEAVCRLPGGRPEGAAGNRGDGKLVVMKNGGATMKAAESNINYYLALIWCSIAAVAMFAMAWALKKDATPKKDGVSGHYGTMEVGDEISF